VADNVTTTEERRARGLARVNRACETCGGQYDQTPDGRMCGTGCLIEPTPTARGPYSKERWRKQVAAALAPKQDDRIAALEAALRQIANKRKMDAVAAVSMQAIARAALDQ
jgi:hypothetical protein